MSTQIVRMVLLIHVLCALVCEGIPLLVRMSAVVVLPSTLEALVLTEWVDFAAVCMLEEPIIVA